ncbi:MAG: DeoR family transcriptional regulator, partial [Halobacteriaceae archaeon]
MASRPPAERRSYVLDQLEENGHVSVGDLSEELSVSSATIRKDLQFLEDQSLLIRTHGGAISANRFSFSASFDEKAQRQKEEKRRIGTAAAKM